MKKVLALVAAIGLISAASAAFGKTIVGSKHDLSPTGKGGQLYNAKTSTQICVYCHAPHNANLSLPLWNRTNPSGASYTLYSGINMQNVSFKKGLTSDSTSLFCMSCHDSATNLNQVYNAGVIESPANSTIYNTYARNDISHFTEGNITGPASLGASKDLSKTHPINFPVSTVDGQSDLNVGANAYMGPKAGTNGQTFPLFKTTNGGGARDTANRSLECGSCHAVHDSQNSPFLRDTMNQSQLCLGCHNK